THTSLPRWCFCRDGLPSAAYLPWPEPCSPASPCAPAHASDPKTHTHTHTHSNSSTIHFNPKSAMGSGIGIGCVVCLGYSSPAIDVQRSSLRGRGGKPTPHNGWGPSARS